MSEIITLNVASGPYMSYRTKDEDNNGNVTWRWNWKLALKVYKYDLETAKHIFVHIPKTGGTSIIHYCHPLDRKIFCLGHCFASVYPKKYRKKMFTIVRNPYSRLVSAYKFMKRGGFFNNLQYKVLVDKYPTFEDWVLNGIHKDMLTYDSKEIVTELLIPQCHYIYENKECKESSTKLHFTLNPIVPESHILKFEAYADEIEKHLHVSKLYQLHYNATQTDKNEWKWYYNNKKVQNKVYRLYFEDFNLFDYDYQV